MIKFINLEQLDKTKPVALNYLLKFTDDKVNNEQCEFIRNHLDNYIS